MELKQAVRRRQVVRAGGGVPTHLLVGSPKAPSGPTAAAKHMQVKESGLGGTSVRRDLPLHMSWWCQDRCPARSLAGCPVGCCQETLLPPLPLAPRALLPPPAAVAEGSAGCSETRMYHP